MAEEPKQKETTVWSNILKPLIFLVIFTLMSWVIIAFMLVLIVALVIIKKALPFTSKSKKEEKKELMRKYPTLVAYINKAKESGMLKEDLKEKLMSKGWPAGIVDKAINCFWEKKAVKGKKSLPPPPKRVI